MLRTKDAAKAHQKRSECTGFAFDKPAPAWQIARQL
jgi:hypothetical protein